ncbi:MAG: ABC transporter permease subunit [Acholeplasmataceae bacterium]|nr:ABC transporter permease subunit [Acholeplasmataceae bacterium]
MTKTNRYILLGVIAILLFWTISSLIIDNSLVLPGLDEVFLAFGNVLGDLSTYGLIIRTILKLVLIISVSLLIAFSFAILSYLSTKFEYFLKPVFVLIKTVPIIAIIILLLIFFGNRRSPYIMTALVVLPIMYEGLLGSLKNINQEIIDDVKTLGKVNFRVIKDLYFPLILPYFITTIIQSLGIGLKVMVMGEFIAQPNRSIGYVLQLERSNLNTPVILVWSIILIAIVLLFEIMIAKISKHLKKAHMI